MICPMCQASSPVGARFCTECGGALPRCRGCGGAVSLGHKFCAACGVPLVTGPSGFFEGATGDVARQEPGGSEGVAFLASIGTAPHGRVRALLHVQLAIPEGGEARSRAFYGGLLGLDELPKPPALRERGGVWYRVGALELHLGVESDFRPARKAHPAFGVDHLERFRRHLEVHGVETRDGVALPDRVRFYCDDPFGNRLEFVQAETGESGWGRA
jgi:catechol 2,3-dioxygenase-like lactoylglutathione lyase family enzyme